MRKPWWVTPVVAVTLLFPYACAAPTKTATAPAVPASFGGTDLAWIELGIAMDQQVLPLLDLVPEHSDDPAVTATAGRVRQFAGTELTALRALHDEAGLPATNPHEGMVMPGLVAAGQVTEAATLTGAAFDAVAVRELRAYLRQASSLARSEQTAGRDPRTRSLAAQAATTHDAELERL